jgi:type I restriction enzyme S subunit
MKNWKSKKLGEVCEIRTGNANTEDAVENGVYAFFDRSKIIKRSSTYLFDCESIIIAGEGATFLPKFYSGKFNLHQRAYAIFNFSKDVDIQYAYKYLIHFHKYFEQVAVGATVKSLRLRHFQELPIPLPPLPEQQRIVAILDDAFAKIGKAKANAEQNLKNAKELFDVYLHKYYTSKEDGWEEKKLKEVAEYFNGLTYSPKDVSNEGIIVLRSSNVQNDELDFKDIVRVKVTVKEKIIVKEGDILMCSRNGSARLVGKTATIKNLDEEMTFGTFMMIVRSEYNPYLSWFFKSTDFRNQIKGGANTMINQITRYMLDDIVLSFPSIEKQNKVVRQLDALSIEIKKLETIYNQKINDLEELKKSVLQKAFSGQLSNISFDKRK